MGEKGIPCEELRKAKDDVMAIKAALFKEYPFFASILARLKIVAEEGGGMAVASVDESNTLTIYLGEWGSLDIKNKAGVLMHEAMHVATMDLRRGKGKDMLLWNLVADAVNNSIINDMTLSKVDFGITKFSLYSAFGVDIDSNDTKEVIYEKIMAKMPKAAWKKFFQGLIASNCNPNDIVSRGHAKRGGAVIQEGDPKLYGDQSPGNEEYVKEMVASAYVAQKAAGYAPASFELEVGGMLAPAVDWRTKLRVGIRSGLSKACYSSWKAPSRKSDSFPGLVKKQRPKVWALIDSSGSITQEEMRRFITEVKAASELSKVHVIVWSAGVCDEFEFSNIEQLRKIKGGGGTLICDALSTARGKMKRGDAVVVLTDTYIADADLATPLAAELKSKASYACVVYNCEPYDDAAKLFKGWEMLKVQ